MDFDPDRKIRVRQKNDLTEMEAEILDCIADNMVPKEIARELNISYWTVRTHLKKIYKKIGVHNRNQAALLAMKNGFGREK